MQDSKPKSPEQQAQERVQSAQDRITVLNSLIASEPSDWTKYHYMIAHREIKACETLIERHEIRCKIKPFSA